MFSTNCARIRDKLSLLLLKFRWIDYQRVASFFRRRFLNFFLPNQVASIFRREQPPALESIKLIAFSPGHFQEIFDPRSNLRVGHFFNPRHLYLIRNALLETRQGTVYTEIGSFISDSTQWPDTSYLSSYPLSVRKKRNTLVLPKAISLSSNSFYHWLIEDLPDSLWVCGLYPDVPIVAHAKAPKYVLDVLTSLNNPKILTSKPVYVEQLFYVNKNKDSGWPNKYSIDYLRESPIFSRHISDERTIDLYVSRRYSTRSPRNELILERELEIRGFQIAHLEKMNIFDQINLISRARRLVGVHGAGLTNLIWMQTGSLVIDIVQSSYWTECYHRLASLRNVNYHPVIYGADSSGEVDIGDVLNVLAG